MDEEILKKVRKIEIKARGLSQQMFSGEYHSAFKGRGMEFSEVREYQYGDDVRNIDWNVTARLAHPYVKIFEEERELTVMLLVDVSGSGRFGTHSQFKEELAAEVAATLAFSAIANNDKVGMILFSDRIEKFIPPKKGRSHILRIIRELITFKPESNGTNIGQALGYFQNVIKKRCTAFLISDFLTPLSPHDSSLMAGGQPEWADALKLAAGKHDIVALRLVDCREERLENLGLVKFYDPESTETLWVDTGRAEVRRAVDARAAEQRNRTETTLKRYGIDLATLYTGEDFVKPLRNLLARRS
ncbi:MAG: DUF58 domain-containing protein [Bacteroidales bacterium]|nr:DUF58 domain-containing protein [Bacteroidales bacterium]